MHGGRPARVLILCTHNSARSQMAEGWVRHHAGREGATLEVHSAGTERTAVKAEAVQVMREVGVDLSEHRSKALTELLDPWNFDVVLTVCDRAGQACPSYPAATRRLDISFPDPTGQELDAWREVRDALGRMAQALVRAIVRGAPLREAELTAASHGPTRHDQPV